MKVVSVTYIIDSNHNIDEYRERAIENQLKRVQENSDHGLIYVGYHLKTIPIKVREKKNKRSKLI